MNKEGRIQKKAKTDRFGNWSSFFDVKEHVDSISAISNPFASFQNENLVNEGFKGVGLFDKLFYKVSVF